MGELLAFLGFLVSIILFILILALGATSLRGVSCPHGYWSMKFGCSYEDPATGTVVPDFYYEEYMQKKRGN